MIEEQSGARQETESQRAWLREKQAEVDRRFAAVEAEAPDATAAAKAAAAATAEQERALAARAEALQQQEAQLVSVVSPVWL